MPVPWGTAAVIPPAYHRPWLGTPAIVDGATTINAMEMIMKLALAYALVAASFAAAVPLAAPASAADNVVFNMVPSSLSCVPNAKGRVTVALRDGFESLHIEVSNLPPRTTFTLFNIQVPKAPFGMAWYAGDITTDANGRATGDFAGRFSIETFMVAQAAAPAPKLHAADGGSNPASAPIHMFHLGLWFDSFQDAAAAGCPDNVTPFNDDHTAGVQVLNTSNFGNLAGPLRSVK
jgi:hypothetical protein